MKNKINKIVINRIVLFLFLVAIAAGVFAVPVKAATQVEIANTKTQKDLVVMFDFDRAVVDVTLISPSGVRKTKSDSDVVYASGNLWATYRVTNAEVGRWTAEYNAGVNRQIEYTVMESNYGLWIQYLNVSKVSDTKVSFAFESDFDGEDVYYDYEIFAVSQHDNSIISKIADGSASANSEKKLEVDFKDLGSDKYVFRLDVKYSGGYMEVFDSMLSDPFEYNNPTEPETIEDFRVRINKSVPEASLDWTDFTSYGQDGYKVSASSDGENIYSVEWDKNTTTDSFLFSSENQELDIRLYYKDWDTWYAPKIKTIDLSKDVISTEVGDVSGSNQIKINYDVDGERVLYAKINDKEGTFRVTGKGDVSFDLEEGSNSVYAEIEMDDLVSFIIEQDVYYDARPPEISIFDEIDGKTFFIDKVTILGQVSGGNILKIQGKEVPVDENGNFEYEAKLSPGDNTVEIEATDANGNSSMRSLTLIRGTQKSAFEGATTWWMMYLPLFTSLLASLLIIILSLAYMKKLPREAFRIKIFPFILWDFLVAALFGVSIWQYYNRNRMSNSMEFLELAEKSVAEAARYIEVERFYLSAVIVCAIVLVASIVLTIMTIALKIKLSSRNKEK